MFGRVLLVVVLQTMHLSGPKNLLGLGRMMASDLESFGESAIDFLQRLTYALAGHILSFRNLPRTAKIRLLRASRSAEYRK